MFRRFDELGSARQVLLSLREDGLLLPRRRNGCPRISWAPATYPAIHDFLSNPAYAGAFVFGRTRTEKRIDPATGRVVTPGAAAAPRAVGGADPRSPSRVHRLGGVRGQHRPAARELAAAARPRRRRPAGGTALLQGLLRCGRCGRIMQTGYSGPARQQPPLCVCPRATAVCRRARLPKHRRRPVGEDRCWPSCSPCWNRRR